MVKLDELERKFTAHDSDIKRLFATVRQLMAPPEPKKRKIGFLVRRKGSGLQTALVALELERFEGLERSEAIERLGLLSSVEPGTLNQRWPWNDWNNWNVWNGAIPRDDGSACPERSEAKSKQSD